jgi:DNA adenine methylase
LGDLNPEVIVTYEALRDTPDEVLDFLYGIPRTADGYYTLRGLDPAALTKSQRAARLLFLMKGCFNGVYRTNKEGRFNVPLGNKFFALPSPEAVRSASAALSGVDLVCGDFSAAVSDASAGDFVYMDPPYSEAVRFRGEYSYRGAFGANDQDRLISTCNELTRKGVQVLLSFKESDAVCEALPGWSIRRLQVTRSVAGFARARGTANELLAFNYTA